MRICALGEAQIEQLRLLPETGMGFQLVEAIRLGTVVKLLVLNSAIAIDLSRLNVELSNDPAKIAQNEARILDELKSIEVTHTATYPPADSFSLISTRVSGRPTNGLLGSLLAATPSSLVKHVSLPANRFFHRFSAYHPDRRVDPVTGNFIPGTYAAPESEVPFAPTGFSAVGRFALPNSLPASHHYVIQAPAGTAVSFGTVAPAFAQAGGGVEAFFLGAVVNQVPAVPPSILPDE